MTKTVIIADKLEDIFLPLPPMEWKISNGDGWEPFEEWTQKYTENILESIPFYVSLAEMVNEDFKPKDRKLFLDLILKEHPEEVTEWCRNVTEKSIEDTESALYEATKKITY